MQYIGFEQKYHSSKENLEHDVFTLKGQRYTAAKHKYMQILITTDPISGK